MAIDKTSPAPVGRVRRTPIAMRNKLSVPNQDPNFHYRIVNDIDGRIEQFIEQGYEVAPVTQVGDKRVDTPSQLGSAPKVSVGNGTKAISLRIRKDWYAEDQLTKQKDIDELEASMNSAAKRGV